MNIKALRAFRATLSEGSLARAAELLHLSQPAVSRLVSGLEGHLRLTLFDRSGRNLTPTPEGLAFYREAGRILDNLDEIPSIASDIRAGRTETLRIVTMPRIAHALVVPPVAEFIDQNPEINVSLDVRARREASKWLAGSQYDVGIGALPVSHPDIRTEVLVRVRAQAVIPRSLPIADKAVVSAEDLAPYLIIRLMRGLLLREQVDDFFGSAGISPARHLDVASSQIACSLAATGVGVTIADELVASQLPTSQVALVPVVPERWMSFGLLLPKEIVKERSTKAVVELFKEHIARLDTRSQTLRQSD